MLSRKSRWDLFVICCGLFLSKPFWSDYVILYTWELLYFGLLIDFHFQREDFEELVDMAYYLRSEDECQQAEDSEVRSGWQFRPTHIYIVDNILPWSWSIHKITKLLDDFCFLFLFYRTFNIIHTNSSIV